MKILRLTRLFFVFSILLISCGDEPSQSSDNNSNNTETKEVKPEIKVITTATTTDQFTVSFRVKSVVKPSVTLRYNSYSSSTSSPTLSKSSNVNATYDEVKSNSGYTWWYYKVTHSGFKQGNYIYYQIEASNSQGNVSSSIGHMIIKR